MTAEPEDEAIVIVAFDDSDTPANGATKQAPDTDAAPDPTPDGDDDDPMQPDEDPDVVTDAGPNHGWIGGPCNNAADCTYDGAICADGQCTLACNGLCPDRDGENSVTFCVTEEGRGRCVAQCDTALYEGVGCRDGYECRTRQRFGDATATASVCQLPGTPGDPEPEPEPEPELPCLQQLDMLGVSYTTWNYTTQYTEGLACTIDDPIYVQSPINGVNYRYFSDSSPGNIPMSCELALALHRFGDVLADFDVTEVEHMGTFNCRKIGGTNDLSMHGTGLAIDFRTFYVSSGADYKLVRDWEHDTNDPVTTKGQWLYDLLVRMYNEQIFNIILTPNFNAAHDDHFHVDLTPGGYYVGNYYSGYDLGEDCGN